MECCLDPLKVPALHGKALNHLSPPPSPPHLEEQLLMVLLDLSRVLLPGRPRLLIVSEWHRDTLGQLWRARLEQGLERRLLV